AFEGVERIGAQPGRAVGVEEPVGVEVPASRRGETREEGLGPGTDESTDEPQLARDDRVPPVVLLPPGASGEAGGEKGGCSGAKAFLPVEPRESGVDGRPEGLRGDSGGKGDRAAEVEVLVSVVLVHVVPCQEVVAHELRLEEDVAVGALRRSLRSFPT